MGRRVEVPPRDVSAPVRVPATTTTGGKKPSGVYSERHSEAQNPLYQQWIRSETPLKLVFSDGSALTGVILTYDTYALQVKTPSGVTLIFKQSLRWIAPVADAPSTEDTQ